MAVNLLEKLHSDILACPSTHLVHCLLCAEMMHGDRVIRVLIVDDDRVDRGLCKQCLQQSPAWEFEFAEADSALAGIEMASAWRPDCTLLDFNLPDMDGIEVLSRLGREPDGLPCATVMLTAYGGEELAVKAMKAGASDYLPKGRLSAGSYRTRSSMPSSGSGCSGRSNTNDPR